MSDRVATILLSAGLIVSIIGCDNKTDVPPLTPDNRPPEKVLTDEKPRPTTQELSQTKQESLSIVPLTITVPQSWGVSADVANLTVLKGFSPHHEVNFHVAMRMKADEDQLARILEGAKRDAAKPEEKGRYLLLDIRDQHGLKVLERQIVISSGDPALGKLLNWTIWFCDKKADAYHIYELNLSDLTVEQYEQDKDFLRAIITSVKPARE